MVNEGITGSIGRLEHVNIAVSDVERSAKLLENLMGWKQRWRGPAQHGGETIHVGEEHSYLALYTDGKDHSGQKKARPLNHIGLLVDDLERAKCIIEDSGLEPYGYEVYEPGARFYFFDWDGVEFEVVSYA